MGQTVYVDLLFMINFSMDFLCFFLCAKLFGIKLLQGRCVLASAIGGAYSVAALFIGVGRIFAFFVDAAVCGIICAVCFGGKGRWRSVPAYILVYLAVSMMLGGVMTAIFNLINRLDLPLTQGSSDGISVWLFAILALISAGITLLGGAIFKKRTIQKNARLHIVYRKRDTWLEAMTDSGNLLRDPISGDACILVDIDSVRTLFSREICDAAKRGDISAIHNFKGAEAKSIRLVPIITAAGESLLIGIRVDEISVDRGRGAQKVEGIIVLSDIKDSADGNKALIPQGIAI